MNFYLFYCSFLVWKTSFAFAAVDCSHNLTDFMQHRQKRSLIWENGGTLKLSIGPSLPVNLGDPVVWRSLVCSYTLQGGHYTMPTTPLYPWDKWEDTFARSMKRMRQNYERSEQYKEDDSRQFAYTALETFMNKQNGNGHECLLRSICENAQVDQHVGVFAELLNVVLTPGKENMNEVYKEARVAGKSGADCLKLYEKCPSGANVLDQYFVEL